VRWLPPLLLFALALGLRAVGLDALLPHWIEPDNVLTVQADKIASGPREGSEADYYAAYPHLIGWILRALPEERGELGPQTALDEHLARASLPTLHPRWVVAALSALIAPATWWLARALLPASWSLLAALLATTSLLHLSFSQQARPHAPLAAALALGVVACLRLRRSPRATSYLLAGLASALALGVLHSGVFVLPALLAAHLRRAGPRRARDAWRLALPLVLVATSFVLFYPFFFEGRAWRSMSLQGSIFQGGTHEIDFSAFDGANAPVMFWGLAGYDPALTVLAALGLALLGLRIAWRAPRPANAGEAAHAALILAAAAVPYAVAFSLYHNTYHRFAAPLVPPLACLAAWGLSELSRLRAPVGRWLALALAAASLLLAGTVAARRVLLASRPDTLELAALWARDHLTADQVLWLPPGTELPVAYAEAALEADLPETYMPHRYAWSRYQREHALGPQVGPRLRVRLVPWLARPVWQRVVSDAPGVLDELQGDFLLCAAYSSDQPIRPLQVLRPLLSARGAPLFRCVPLERGDGLGRALLYQHEGSARNTLFLDVLRARHLGPAVEIYALSSAGR